MDISSDQNNNRGVVARFYGQLTDSISKNNKILTAIGGVYITQTMISMLIMQSIPTLLRNQGVSLSLIGLTSLFMLPWTFKFLWAPQIERLRLPAGEKIRRSRMLILLGQVLVALLFLMMAMICWKENISQLDSVWMFSAFFLCAFLTSTVDISCDGMAVEQIASGSRRWGNIAQVGGGEIGALLGTGGFLLLVSCVDLMAALMITALVIILLTIPMFRFKESERPALSDTCHVPGLIYAFKRKEVRIGILVIVLLEGGNRVTDLITGPLLIDRQFSLDDVALLMGGFSFIAGLLGTLLGGFLIKTYGVWRAVFITYGMQGVVLFLVSSVVSVHNLSPDILFILIGLKYIFVSSGLVASYTGLMGLSSLKQAGVDFTIFQCANALIAMLAGLLGGWLAGHWSYHVVFSVSSAYTLIAVLISIFLVKRLPDE